MEIAAQIEIDFNVYKALTVRREHEGHSFKDVLRDLLELDPVQETDPPASHLESVTDALKTGLGAPGYHSRGLYLPDGTLLRARYKQRTCHGRIDGGQWLDDQGHVFASTSAAATAITGTNVNGLRFWEAQRPGERGWRRLELLRDR